MWAVVPIKPSGQAKSRLSHHFRPALLSRLFIAMLKDVLTALQKSPAIERLLLVSSAARAGALATEFNAELLKDDGEGGLNGACGLAARYLARQGADRLLIIHGDVPLINTEDIGAIACAHPPNSTGLTLFPNSTETGTNGLVVSPPELILPFQFGAGSLQRYRQAAQAAAIQPQILRLPHLSLDVDTPEDVQQLQTHQNKDSHSLRLLAGLPTECGA